MLFEIDPRPFAATLKQAQANLLKDKALLDRAVEQEKRYKDLLAKNFISPDAYEQVRTNTGDRGRDGARRRGRDRERQAVSSSTARSASPVTGYAGRSRSSRATWSRPTTPIRW